jgi:hypothetical protein
MEISRKLPGASLPEYRFHLDLDLCFRLRETADPHHRAVAGGGDWVRVEIALVKDEARG